MASNDTGKEKRDTISILATRGFIVGSRIEIMTSCQPFLRHCVRRESGLSIPRNAGDATQNDPPLLFAFYIATEI